MLDFEEKIILEDESLTTQYKYSLFSNVTQHDYIDFFIALNTITNINYVDVVIEYCTKKEPTSLDWARVQMETFDTEQEVYFLSDYVLRKNIYSPLTFSIRTRSQGKLMRIGVKANQNGGSVTATSFRKKRT